MLITIVIKDIMACSNAKIKEKFCIQTKETIIKIKLTKTPTIPPTNVIKENIKTPDKLLDYVFNTPSDPLRSVKCVEQRCDLIKKNLEYLANNK